MAAGLEAVAFQTRDLLDAMRKDMAQSSIPNSASLRVDGGMTANAWFLQRLADILGERVEVARHPETTALGAAYPRRPGKRTSMASQEDLQRGWVPSRAFEPAMSEAEREARYGGWRDALAKVRFKL